MSKQLINIIAVGMVTFILGYSASFFGGNTFQDGWDAAEQRLTETNIMAPIFGEDFEIDTVNGIIQKITDNEITVKIQPLTPLASPDLDTRIIEITDDTQFYQLVKKDAEQFEKEYEEFNKKIQGGDFGGITSPEPFSEKIITPDQIQVGQHISAIAGENIKDTKRFKVIKIITN